MPNKLRQLTALDSMYISYYVTSNKYGRKKLHDECGSKLSKFGKKTLKKFCYENDIEFLGKNNR